MTSQIKRTDSQTFKLLLPSSRAATQRQATTPHIQARPALQEDSKGECHLNETCKGPFKGKGAWPHLLEDASIALVPEQDEELAQLRPLCQQLQRWRQLQHVRSQRLVLVRAALPDARALEGLQQIPQCLQSTLNQQ